MIATSLALAIAAQSALPEMGYKRGDGVSHICGVSASGPAALIRQIEALPGIEMHEQIGDYVTFIQVHEKRFWTFVKEPHPAAPAVICRTITSRPEGGSTLSMEVSCFADKSVCDKLARDFVAHNRRVLEGTVDR